VTRWSTARRRRTAARRGADARRARASRHRPRHDVGGCRTAGSIR
jgi:hypothetical protein